MYGLDITENKHQGNTESFHAWQKALHTMAKCRREVYDLIVEEPRSAKEIAEILGKSFHKVSGRCTELKKDGLIEPTDEVRAGSRVLRVLRSDE